MSIPPYQHRTILLKSGFQYEDNYLFFSRARLFPDRIELSGWYPGRQHREVIPLMQVAHVEWKRESSNKPNVVLHLDDGSSRKLALRDLEAWEHSLSECLRWMDPGSRFEKPDLPFKDLIAYATSMS